MFGLLIQQTEHKQGWIWQCWCVCFYLGSAWPHCYLMILIQYDLPHMCLSRWKGIVLSCDSVKLPNGDTDFACNIQAVVENLHPQCHSTLPVLLGWVDLHWRRNRDQTGTGVRIQVKQAEEMEILPRTGFWAEQQVQFHYSASLRGRWHKTPYFSPPPNSWANPTSLSAHRGTV